MLRMAVHTFRARWTLFVGTVLSVVLGVALVESSALILQAASALGRRPDERLLSEDVSSIIGITLIVGVCLSVFIIGSTFSFTVAERRRELALLRLVGATRRQLRLLLVGESLVVGLIGGGLGALAGPALVPVQLATLRRLGLDTDLLDVRLSAQWVLLGVAAGVGVAVVGVWIASRRAVRVRALDALRDVGAAARVMTLGRWLWGLGAAAGTVGAVLTVQASGDPLVGIAVSILVIFTAAIALQQLSPLLVPAVARLAGLVARRSAEGEIAHVNLIDGRRRAATTAGPLIAMVGVILGLYGTILSQTEATVRDWETSTTADLVVLTEPGDASAIRRVAGVEEAVPIATVPARLRVGRRATAQTVTLTDPASYRAVMTPRLSAGSTDDFTDATAIVSGDPDGPFPRGRDKVVLSIGAERIELPVAARTGVALADFSVAVIALDLVDPTVVAKADARVMVRVADGARVADVRAALTGAGYEVQVLRAWAEGDTAATADANLAVTFSLAGLGAIYALLAVINAVALAAAARKREFAVDRIAGLTRAQVIRTSALEALGAAVIGLALGCVAAALTLVGIRKAFVDLLGEPVLVVPWTAFGVVGTVSLVAVATTAGVATWSATRETPISLAAARE